MARANRQKQINEIRKKLVKPQLTSKSTQSTSSESKDLLLSIDNKLQTFSSNILNDVTALVEEKLSKVGNQVQELVDIPEKINENYKTFKDVLAQNTQPSNTAP